MTARATCKAADCDRTIVPRSEWAALTTEQRAGLYRYDSHGMCARCVRRNARNSTITRSGVPASCGECGISVVPQRTWADLDDDERDGKARHHSHGYCDACSWRRRKSAGAAVLSKGVEALSNIRWQNWRDDAACVDQDPEIFQAHGLSAVTRKAKQICHGCPVRMSCLSHALDSDEIGVWGGLTDEERRELRKQSERSAVA